MAAPKKEFHQCGHCGREQTPDKTLDDGFIVDLTHNRIACSCGLMTRCFPTKQQLQVCWNSKAKKPFVAEEITVKHPPTRGMTPDTVHGKKKPF